MACLGGRFIQIHPCILRRLVQYRLFVFAVLVIDLDLGHVVFAEWIGHFGICPPKYFMGCGTSLLARAWVV